MNQEELNRVQEEHNKWQLNPNKGKQADLSFKDLRGLHLSGDWSGATLTDADLTYVNFLRADLTDADLNGADLTYAKLKNANLTGTGLIE